MDEEVEVTKHGLKLKLNHVYPELRRQIFKPTWKIFYTLFPLIYRYVIYYIRKKWTGTSIVMDYLHVQGSRQIYGVPIGGIGAGTIGRGFRGEFCRFQLRPGLTDWDTVDANQFIITIKDSKQSTIFHSLLSTFPKHSLGSWESHLDASKCQYTGLYPRGWTEYDLTDYGIKLACRQLSPIIPHNYKDSSLPCAVFIWSIDNVTNEQRTVTIAFTFKNGTGNVSLDRASTCSTKAFSYMESEGVVLHHTIDKMPCTYALSAKPTEGVTVSKCLYFDPCSSGIEPWTQLKDNGKFDVTEKTPSQVYGEMGCGIAAKTSVETNKTQIIEMSLVWDMPTIVFPLKRKKYNRMYTNYFGAENATLTIVDYVFKNYKLWEKAIYMWQKETLNNKELPNWFKTALFNQSYFINDGGTIWLTLDDEEKKKLQEDDPRRIYGRFAYLEGLEYKMYNTYDVHFYASYALLLNWPFLQYSLQYDMRDAIFMRISTEIKMLYDGNYAERKVVNTVPHDIGDPGEEPFTLINSYPIHDVSLWRDLNTKFVLQVFRDASLTPSGQVNVTYLRDMYDACYTVMMELKKFDVDNDGLIENSNSPDQTYDTWTMYGSSSYCGGLWLAALFAMTKMAEILDKNLDQKEFEQILEMGRESFEKKLWNGKYYNFDCSTDERSSIMADQLCGHWYLRSCGYNYEVFPKSNVRSSLTTIFEKNVQSFCGGNLGAVNGFIHGGVDLFTVQSQEVWTGVTYAVAAHMMYEGLTDEAFKTAGGMYRSLTDLSGMSFETPEAIYEQKWFRSISYMRPLSIWAMKLAWDQTHPTTS